MMSFLNLGMQRIVECNLCPMTALEVLDKARWDWLEENGRWYSFNAAEIEVYAAKLILLHHWRRILSDNQQNNKKE